MQIQVASDLHLEMMKEHAQDRVMEQLLPLKEVDAIVLAGDILNPKNAERVISWFCKHYPHVVYVTGNHEYAGYNLWETDDELSRLSTVFENFHHLYPERGTVTIAGQRFIGGTLWYPMTSDAWIHARNWFDFIHIKDLSREQVHEMNRFTIQKFTDELQQGDVVVTHMAPTYASVGAKFKTAVTNCFFANRLDDLILEKKPKLWIHGHMHDVVDYMVGSTRVIANPRGYSWHGEGFDFDPHYTINF